MSNLNSYDHPFAQDVKVETVLGDNRCFIVLHQCSKWGWKRETELFDCFLKACEYAVDIMKAHGGEAQILEFNPVEGYCIDISIDAPIEYGLHYYLGTLTYDEELEDTTDPNEEHRLGAFEYGVGGFGRVA